MRTLLVDNRDSYTYNLFQLIAEVNGTDPVVLRNDDPSLVNLAADAFDAVVISPGPGRPQCGRDIGHVTGLLRQFDLPVLGVCLGHQAIAYQAGATVAPAPRPRHGHLTTVRHNGDDLFAGIPEEFTAVRYHSLCAYAPLPATLTATAWAEDGVIMAMRHLELPQWGVQFHPESIATDFGRELLTNFARLAGQARRRPAGRTGRASASSTGPRTSPAPRSSGPAATRTADRGRRDVSAAGDLQAIVKAVPAAADAETVFTAFFASSPNCFWLDSSMVQPGLSRFSFLGDGTGPLSETLTYRLNDGKVTITDASGERAEPGNGFDVLERRLSARRLPAAALAGSALPFTFTGGYVGYFGYEMKADCGADAVYTASTPDALWIFADRLIALDHETGAVYLVAIHDGSERLHAAADAWIDHTGRRLAALPPSSQALDPGQAGGPGERQTAEPRLADYLVRDQAGYQADIEECKRQLVLGESYEICLTNRLHLPFDEPDLSFYLRLRRVNPAPYAALLRGAGVTVFSSSPERFLRIDSDRRVESKPVKGTAPRHRDPVQDARIAEELATSPKTRAENLMIVDLLRNDLGQVCEIGSVEVSRFMDVESYATVHQLVSTVQGRLRPGCSAVECVRRCFPGGSMTGAPKLRTMEIIDRLEGEARGVYSGVLGYFALNGSADLSIVIRTAVRHGDTLSVGAGGAIVLDSSPADEYEEMMLKAAAPLRAYRQAAPAAEPYLRPNFA